MGQINLFRLTAIDDDETTMDRVLFNITTHTNIESAHIDSIEYSLSDGVGNNQGVEQELGDQQALGMIEDIIKISGYISQRRGFAKDGANQFLILMNLWESETKINDFWPLGRFGIIDDDDHTEDLIPVNTGENHIALLWEKIKWKTDFDGNRKIFELYLRVNRGDGS